jgi:hypothetical protein
VETWSTVMTRVSARLANDASSSMPPLGVTTAQTLVCLPMRVEFGSSKNKKFPAGPGEATENHFTFASGGGMHS